MAEIDLQPTEEMASNARRGLELRKKHGKGGTAIGVARARDISNRKHLSPETVRRMHAFFNRHEKNKSGGEDDAGYIAWLLWGGDSGKSWAARKFEQLKDKQENARMERSDQLAAKLMKPVTISNHKAMEKIVDEAIAHAKRVGDDDLLELAEETGHEILALRSRASRPGKRTEFAARLAGHPQRKKILELMYDFAVDTDAKGIIVYDKSDVAAIREVLRKNKISPMVNVSVADDYSGGSYHARPGAKAEFVSNRSNLAAVGKQLRDSEKAIDTARSLLREDAKQARWGDCINRCEYISQKYQDLKVAYRNYAREAGAWSNPTTASRSGAKAVFASVPSDFKTEERALMDELQELKAAYRRAEADAILDGAKGLVFQAKSIAEICVADARDMKKYPQAWNNRPGAKAKFTLADVLLDAMYVVKNDEPSAGSFVDEATKAMTRYRDEMTANDRDWLLYKKLIALAERKGIRISKPMTLRASRPGAKATMGAPSMQEVRSRLAWIEKNIDSAEQSLRSASKQGKFQECHGWCKVIAAEFAKLGATYLQWDAAAKALNASRPGAKAEFAAPASAIQAVMQAHKALSKQAAQDKADGDRESAKLRTDDAADMNKILRAIQSGDGGSKHAERISSMVYDLDTEVRDWIGKGLWSWLRSQKVMDSRPGAKAEFAPITGRTGMNDREKMRVMDQAIRASGMTEMELKENHPEIYQSVDRIRRNPGFYSVKDAAHIANKIKELKATASRPGAKAAMGLEGACWEGYEAVGTKKKDGKTVPDCVPKSEAAQTEESEDVRSGLKMIAAKDAAVADKIRTLIHEGKPQKQAVAIALDLKRRGEI